MENLTLESLARRVEAIERQLQGGIRRPTKDWRSVIGSFEDTETARDIDAAALAIRERDRFDTRDSGVSGESAFSPEGAV